MRPVLLPELHKPGLHTVDGDGDVILEVGKDYVGTLERDPTIPSLRILASSDTRICSSPVFRAMLAGTFAEAQVPFTKENPPTVRFPEDSPAATLFYCQIIHPTYPESKLEPHYLDLSILLEFCDKYDCLRSLHPWLDAGMAEDVKEKTRFLDKELEGKLGFAALAGLSYLINDSELFRIATASLIYYKQPDRVVAVLEPFFPLDKDPNLVVRLACTDFQVSLKSQY
ncbi:hypothetical protein H2200_001155 [Cladophialophora chaetospira]|uniref:BTB domain-containing protein n=1 Tax=Cladophialophora chaetospira TaxID=386627 RepID=A0AA38XKF2_9EURO|nr:hypothetical protein H2200_001155 [Cladophialophora chaetospira]